MNANDLASLLRGANITFNFHSGTGDINSQSGHRITQNNQAAPERAEAKRFEWTYRCETCGYTSHTLHDFISQRGVNDDGYLKFFYYCTGCTRKAEQWKVTRQEAIDADTAPAQIAAPQDAPELIVIDEPRMSRYETATRKADEAFVSWMAGQGDNYNG